MKWNGFTYTVAVTTVITLLLQLMLLYQNQCSVADPKSRLVLSSLRAEVVQSKTVTKAPKQTQNESTVSHLYVAARKPVQRRRLTIGIPTIHRPNKDYFPIMLKSMLNKTSPEDLKNIIFVVFLADLGNEEWKSNMEATIISNYSEYVASGSLEVMQAPSSFYKTMRYGNDSYKNWRTKQNFDYAYLMKYSEHLSDLYMQMEDDVIATDGYFTAIMDFVESQPDENWVCLEFSTLGFIGKLYHSPDINSLADIILIFNYSQPVDYLFVYFNKLSGKRTAIRKPTLFQHLGYHSSLAKKIQPLQDKFFDFPEKEIHGDNPPALVQTTLKYNNDFPPALAYSDEPGFFWSSDGAKNGQTFSIIFNDPQVIKGIQIDTSLPTHPADKVHNAVLEASPTVRQVEDEVECYDFIQLAKFEDGRIKINKTEVNSKVGLVKIKCLQIRFIKDQREWVLIKEIAVFVEKNIQAIRNM